MRMRTSSICVVAVVLLMLFVLGAVPALAAGSLVARGDNTYGECNVPAGNNYVAVATSYVHNVALKSDGSLVAWGYNAWGQCNVPGGNNYVAICAGGFHSMALKSDGSLAAWGENSYGQCDVPAGNNYAAVSAGGAHSVALKLDGSLVAWGDNSYGQCDVPAGNDYAAVAAGVWHNVALKSDGSLVAWGYNDHGQCDVPAGNNYAAVAAGVSHNVALKSDGSLTAWGDNYYGQCDVPAGNNYVAVAAGYFHSAALKSDGSVVAWGYNWAGQCNIPAGSNYAAVAAGNAHSVAIADAPKNVSVTPSGGTLPTGTPFSIQGVYSEMGGYTNIKKAYLLLNDSLTQSNAALFYYDRVTNRVYLKNDANTSWGTGYAPGTAVTLSNSQCDVSVGSTTVSGSGTNLTVNWSITLKSPFSAKNLNAYMYMQDMSGVTAGWDLMGIYYNVKPQVVSIAPNSGPLPIDTPTTLTSLYRDPNGFADLRKCFTLVCEGFNQANAMLLWYDKATNKVYLKNDANTSWGTGYAPGSAITLSNSQCEVYLADTTATGSGNDLTVVWSFKLKVGMTGKNLYSWMYVTDSKGALDGWKKVGTHFTPLAPTCVSVTPSAGKVQTGTPLVFTTDYADANGYMDIWQCYFQIGQSGSLANSVCALYDAKQNKVFLRNDGNSSWGTGQTPGTVVTLENSQCRIYVQNTVVTPSGSNDLLIDWSIELKPILVPKLLGERMFCRDNEYMNSAWKLKGYVRAQ